MSRAKGLEYEDLAAQYLEKQGLTILERNYQCRQGEIDIVAKNREFVIFIEVKYRKNNRFGEPFAFVDTKKQRRLIKTALHFSQQKGLHEKYPMRFDVISIQPQDTQFDIQWLKNAFTTDGF